ncbi:MAG: hypothetical protein E6R03_12140 [Hyphomicrobiaceae bacterium]|nr:MAG: hypothetical protein E6R03_12140 [Hyphomicrobiaceae bacterium]
MSASLPIVDEPPIVQHVVTASTTGPFSVPFPLPILYAGALRVAIDGVETTAFSFTPDSSSGIGYPTGEIELSSAVESCVVTIWRDLAPTRDSDYASGPITIDSLNAELTRLTMMIQDARLYAQQVITLSDGVPTPTPVNGNLLAWGGADLVNVDPGGPIVLLVSGQSNALVGGAYDWTVPDNLQVWNWDGDPTHVGTAFEAPTGAMATLGLGMAAEVAREYPFRDVYLVNIARSGTPIANWLPLGSPDMYAAVKDNIEAALALVGVATISAFGWWQGEDDATAPTNYITNFQTFHTNLRAEDWFPRETPIVVMGTTILSSAEIAAFNDYLVALEQTSSNITYVYTAELPAAFWDATPPYTYLHMTGEGYYTAGLKAARALLSGERSSAADDRRAVSRRSIILSGTTPYALLQETDQAANSKNWWAPLASGGVLYFGPASDALVLTESFRILRSGVTNFAISPTYSSKSTARDNLDLGLTHGPSFASLTLSSAQPVFGLTESDQGVDAKHWWLPVAIAGVAVFGPVSDALVATTSYTISRAGVVNFAISPTFSSPTGTRTNLGVGTGDMPAFAGVSLTENSTLTKAQAADTKLTLTNTQANAAAAAKVELVTTAGTAYVALASATAALFASYLIAASPGGILLNAVSDVAIIRNSVTAVNITANSLDLGLPIKLKNYTVGTLPAAATAGAYAMTGVSDANAPTYNATVAAGGAVKIPVMSDGANWKCR